ncbi:MAG: hypothetical protein L6V81_10300 [Clostridium sp.]|nr:MAG: hypothetical protein L6V81_10300 [Clostridium sp.]
MCFFIYVGVLIGLRSKSNGIFFLITLLLIGFYMMIPTELYSYLFTDNCLYGDLITVLFIITCISIIVLITITCIYNLNDKFKLNKGNFIGILFSYIIPIILFRVLSSNNKYVIGEKVMKDKEFNNKINELEKLYNTNGHQRVLNNMHKSIIKLNKLKNGNVKKEKEKLSSLLKMKKI